MTHRQVIVRELERDEMVAILERNRVGRIAFTFHDRVDIEPIHYAYDDGYVYCRTAPGTKLLTLARHPWVAFEVDEVDALFQWRSVVLHGTFYPLDPDGSDVERHAYDQALTLLRQIVPAALLEDDPTPRRRVLFRIAVDQMTGRAAAFSI